MAAALKLGSHITQSRRCRACDSTQRRGRRRIVDKLQGHRRPAADFWEITFILSAPSRDSCSHKNIRRRRAVDMHFVAVVTAADRES